MAANAPLKVGLIGCGNVVANDHAPALRQLGAVEAVAVSDPAPANRKRVLESLGLPPEAGFETHLAMLEAHSLDYALIATPPNVRGRIVADCAARGVHVLSEKPLSSDHPAYRLGLAGLHQVTSWSGSRPLQRGLLGE